MTRILLFLTMIAIALCLFSLEVQAKDRHNGKLRVKRAAAAVGGEGTPTTKLLTRNDRLTNAERIARGLPLRQPKRLYDATTTHMHKARAS
ncbi:hypothetical protein IAU59_006841 [Kwoniella sp. CBS 9459]